MIEVTIDSIRINLANYQRVVMLKEKTAERYLPIWIGPNEANAIAVKLQGVAVPRPLTHDLLCSVIDILGASVESIIINDLEGDVFYAKIILNVDGGRTEVDSRPSDTLALAIRAEVPIFVEEAVLGKAGILQEEETGKPVPQPGEGKTVSEEDLRRMSAFTDFVDTLNFDDLGREERSDYDKGD